jgi:hypothetical protein
MHFSKNSQYLMNFFLNDVEKYLKKPSAREQRFQDIIIKKIYKDIYNSDIFVSNLINHDHLLKKRKNIVHPKDVPSPSLLDSSYVPVNIKTYIKNSAKSYLHYSCKLFDRKVNIYITLFKKTQSSQESKNFEDMVRHILMWLRMAFLYSPQYCGKNIKIYLYWTPFEKKIPTNIINVLGADNCNSAVTTSCTKNGVIVIYRKEEWFKVFIHETFHSLGLDFSTFSCNNIHYQLHKLFPLNSEFNIYEAYSEFWATIINCLFSAYELLDNKLDERDFLLYSDFCIQFERIFSLFQLVKILNFMGLSYKHLYEKNEISDVARKYLYKERTNVFSYYIAKNILLYNYGLFLQWCDKNNINTLRFDKYDNNLNKFFHFIQSNYKDERFIEDYNNMRVFAVRNKKKEECKPLFETLRMTICELK